VTLSGFGSSALAINNSGQVVGEDDLGADVPFSPPMRAVFYSDGQITDLNDLIDPALGIRLTAAVGINDNGQIVADGGLADNAGQHGFLLTPIPEPSTMALFGAAFTIMAMASHKVLRN